MKSIEQIYNFVKYVCIKVIEIVQRAVINNKI